MVGRETMMTEIVTVPERKAREAARRRAAARDVMSEAREFATIRGGRFYVFGSVAEDRIKYDSDFDVVVDFPAASEAEAAEFVEEACRRRDLPPDVHLKSRARERFLDRIRDHMVALP
jgi:predicted nucleotidyltransferase